MASKFGGPRHSYSISHLVILQVIDYRKREHHIYKVTTYKMLDFLLDLANRFTKYGSRKIEQVDPESEETLVKWMLDPWNHGLRETELWAKCEEWFILEIGKKG